mgnify:FL=1
MWGFPAVRRQAGFVFQVFHDGAYRAPENAAEGLDGVGADAFVPFETGQLAGADMVIFYQRVLGNSAHFQDIP